MPPAPRKSTGNARSKKHIPYRHDDLQHGKRTGMAVDVVDRNSDDFEPFEKILSQADTRTPPRVKGGKRKSTVPSPAYEDEDGEMSMDLASPITYFSSRRVGAPESLINAGSFSRASYLSPGVDFDEIPSPPASVAAISTSRRRSSVKLNGKSPGSAPRRSRLSQPHLSSTSRTITARKSRVEGSPELPGDSEEDFNDGFEPPPTLEYRSRNAPPSLSPEQVSLQDLSREEHEQQVTPEPVTPARNSRQKAKDQSTRTRESKKPLFLPDSEEEPPEASPSKPKERRKSSKVSVAQVEPEPDEEEEEVWENSREDVEVEVDYNPPIEDFDSRRGRKLSSIIEAPELEEDEPEAMVFEQDAGPPEDPEEPLSIGPPKKRGRKKISFDENSTNARRPSKKPRLNHTPLADRTSDPRYVSIRPGKHSSAVVFWVLIQRDLFLFLLCAVTASPENPQGLRRSRRYRYPPLDWWRLEKVVYGAEYGDDQDDGSEDEGQKAVTLVPPIKAILRVPQDPIEPLGKKHKRRRGKSVTLDPESVPFPEAGWDKDTEAIGHVLDYTTMEEVKRRIAFTTRMSRETPAKKADYSYQRIFSEGDNMAAGHIQLEPGAEKPNKSSKDNSYVRSAPCILGLFSLLTTEG
jgi:centromere protein C